MTLTATVGTKSAGKVAFVGPFGVGKTTAVDAVSAGDVTTTEVPSSGARHTSGRHIKPTTTVGLELGDWITPDGKIVSLVGTPGQERFDDVRKSAMPRSNGVVLWLYGHHEHALLDCELWLHFITQDVAATKLTIAVTRLDEASISVEDFQGVVAQIDDRIPVLAADPRDRASVERILLAALRLPTPSLETTS